ncbi:hypothetical protein [Streptomyces sp. CMB-StM0423]|nr:hypothetical protein [Streptomyces sp. CMB-StM0423]
MTGTDHGQEHRFERRQRLAVALLAGAVLLIAAAVLLPRLL